MSIVIVQYTVRSVTRELHHDGHGVAERVKLSLDAQPGAPIDHWGSMPHAIDLMNSGLALGQKLTLTITGTPNPE